MEWLAMAVPANDTGVDGLMGRRDVRASVALGVLGVLRKLVNLVLVEEPAIFSNLSIEADGPADAFAG